jgi:hypothetical protein
MKNELDIAKLMDQLYGEGDAEGQDEQAFLAENPELAAELSELKGLREELYSFHEMDLPAAPIFPLAAVASTPKLKVLRWPMRIAAALALLVLGFLLGNKVQVRMDDGELAFSLGSKPKPVQVISPEPVLAVNSKLSSADTQSIQLLVREELALYHQLMKKTITQAQYNLRHDNQERLKSLQNEFQQELMAMNTTQRRELEAILAKNQEASLVSLVRNLEEVQTQNQGKLKWIIQQGFVDWNVRREADLERIREEFNRVYTEVSFQKTEQDKLNRAIIQRVDN